MSASALAPFYSGVAARIARLERDIQSSPRIRVTVRWVRDMPAEVLRKAPRGAASSDPLWTGGFRVRHSRFVRRDAFPAYHISDGVTTAAAEVFGGTPQRAPVLGVPDKTRLQLVIDADVPEVVDLTDARVRRRLKVSKRDIVEVPDWTKLDALGRPAAYELTQCIGELAFRSGAGGVLFPSSRATRGKNLAIFTDNLAAVGGRVHATDPFTGTAHELP